MTSEEQVYVRTKRLFRADDWNLLASDPPRGTDVPRLEIKEPGGAQSLTKNKNAVINDLVYCKDGRLLLVECKDDSAKTSMDVEKLNRMIGNRDWRESLVTAMSGRSLFAREGAPSASAVRDGDALVPVLAYPGEPRSGLPRFVQITFARGESRVRVGDEVAPAVRERLRGISS
ncbi:hypothetical protein [Halorubrum sp. CBA1229]|uniref:hypothetical protein n=1 Tax=Halorubrum sp. CBA1229 TaxID=1853699 RepID=UPI000F3FEC89|nr:hypothetical protein [Halorubrum sp. CBA1229]QKY17238.1 hypothetical protein Hrr1229_010200 [Halorubrum sp. CBA1229]